MDRRKFFSVTGVGAAAAAIPNRIFTSGLLSWGIYRRCRRKTDLSADAPSTRIEVAVV